MSLKLFFIATCFIVCSGMIACHSKSNTGNTWDSTSKHTMPGDSTVNKIDTSSSSSSSVDTVKMMNDTSQQ